MGFGEVLSTVGVDWRARYGVNTGVTICVLVFLGLYDVRQCIVVSGQQCVIRLIGARTW